MKNIIKIVGSALVASLALSSVAFAAPTSQSNPDSAGTRSNGPASQSNPDSAGTRGNGPSSQSNPDSAGTVSDNGGGTTSGGSVSNSGGNSTSGGGSGMINISLTNIEVNVVGNKATVTWDTYPMAQGMLVYGTKSLVVPTNDTQFYGYSSGTVLTGATAKHSHTITMAPNVTYFVRPMAIVGVRVVYGSEVKIAKITGTTVTKTAAPAIKTGLEAPTSTIPSDVNAANVSATKGASFFKRLWNSITAPFCN